MVASATDELNSVPVVVESFVRIMGRGPMEESGSLSDLGSFSSAKCWKELA